MSQPAIVTSLEDFRQQFGDGPRLSTPEQRARALGIENVPKRFWFLAMHPHLLRLAYRLRPSWRTSLAVHRIKSP